MRKYTLSMIVKVRCRLFIIYLVLSTTEFCIDAKAHHIIIDFTSELPGRWILALEFNFSYRSIWPTESV
jgi:hypothetical protein